MIDFVIDARARDIGGMEVGRLLPSPRRRMIGPFIFLDHMGPAATGGDVLPHPQIGLSRSRATIASSCRYLQRTEQRAWHLA